MTPEHVFETLYSALPQHEAYRYELRALKRGAHPLVSFLSYHELVNVMRGPRLHTLQAKNTEGYHIYFGINPRRSNKGDKANIGGACALYVDIDIKDFLPSPAREREDLTDILARKGAVILHTVERADTIHLPPSVAIDSGRGLQLYWVLDPPIVLPDASDANWGRLVSDVEQANQRLAQYFNGDHVGNIDRIFRFPGFANRKPVRKGSAELANLPVEILECDADRRYALADFAPACFPGDPAPALPPPTPAAPVVIASGPRGDDDAALIQKAQQAKNGIKFSRLWRGDYAGYTSANGKPWTQSEAEFALCCLLVYWTKGDRNRIDRLFRQSGLYRAKWNTPFSGTTNGWYTIDKALAWSQANAQPAPRTRPAFVERVFWFERTVNEGKDTERVELKIDYRKFLAFLQANGFGLLIQDKQVQIVRTQDHIVSTTIEKGNVNLTIKQFTLEYLRWKQAPDVEEVLLKQHGTFFSTAFLTALKPLTLTFYRDTAARCCLFFRNGFVEITKTGADVQTQLKPYADLHEAIWETHTQERDYRGAYSDASIIPDADTPSVFEQFLRKCAVEEDESGVIADNFAAFQYAYAYLLHDYKDQSNARAVICVDNDAGLEANGRRGKSLFCEALKRLRRVSVEDGRTMKTDNNQFMFQTLDLDSQILMIDDARPKFDFAQFYPSITGDMAMERKRDQRLILPFARSPKFVITTNHAILGNGDSHVGRWYVLPFTHYFTAEYSPLDEFQQRLFVEWDDQEWQRFFDASIDCIVTYFRAETPVVANLGTYNESKLKSSMCAELLDYFEDWLSCLPWETQKKIFFEDFKRLHPVYEKSTQNWFTSKLLTYCKIRNIIINPGHPDGRCFRNETADGRPVKVEYLIFQQEGGENDATPKTTTNNETPGRTQAAFPF